LSPAAAVAAAGTVEPMAPVVEPAVDSPEKPVTIATAQTILRTPVAAEAKTQVALQVQPTAAPTVDHLPMVEWALTAVAAVAAATMVAAAPPTVEVAVDLPTPTLKSLPT